LNEWHLNFEVASAALVVKWSNFWVKCGAKLHMLNFQGNGSDFKK
jgi:hypothetical protein